jgi:hypothetical protein
MHIHVFLCFHLSFVVLFCFLFGCSSFQLKYFWSFLVSVSWKSHCKDQVLYCSVHFLQFLTVAGSRMITVLNVTSSKECMYTSYLLLKQKIVQRFLWNYYLRISCTHHSYLHPPTHPLQAASEFTNKSQLPNLLQPSKSCLFSTCNLFMKEFWVGE